jgi:hypothetical protein
MSGSVCAYSSVFTYQHVCLCIPPVSTDESMDVKVGAPPRSYRPSFWVPTNTVQPYELTAKPPPLLADPPLPSTAAYRQVCRFSFIQRSFIYAFSQFSIVPYTEYHTGVFQCLPIP